MPDEPPYAAHSDSWCTGDNARKYTKTSLLSCMTACRRAGCACVAYRDTTPNAPRDNCKYVGDRDWRGLSKSKTGFAAYVRSNASPSSAGGGAAAATVRATCSVADFNGLALLQPSSSSTPRFYLHRPSAIDERALAECYLSRMHRVRNSSSKNPKRMINPDALLLPRLLTCPFG